MNEIKCKVCSAAIQNSAANWLECDTCKQAVHVECTKRECTPGCIHGDIFFIFTCAGCSNNHVDTLRRKKLTWFQIIVLVLYHHEHKLNRSSRQGFFHWKLHLVSYIDKMWSTLFPMDFKRKKSWMGTIAGTLSHCSHTFFTSGFRYLRQAGWWKLTFPTISPKTLYTIYDEFRTAKIYNKSAKDAAILISLVSKYAPNVATEFDVYGINSAKRNGESGKYSNADSDLEQKPQEDTVPLQHNYDVTNALKEIDRFPEKTDSQFEYLKNLFKTNNKSYFKNVWQKLGKRRRFKSRGTVPLSGKEERSLLKHVDCTSCKERALKRKLVVRALKRENRCRVFNAVEFIPKYAKEQKKNRFSHYQILSSNNWRMPMEMRIVSGKYISDKSFISPYTCRMLKPFIRRDFETQYPWLQLMAELQLRTNSKCKHWKLPLRHPVDFFYARPYHIPVINSLCERYFWPGIDMAEVLEYPDFSCVAMYKRLVIGFAFMVPDVHIKETYISFIFTLPAWRNCGLAKFMMYHLMQSCLGKDVTLHVGIDNPAIFLYQRFGFKVEEVDLNFYEKYLPDGSNQSRHAFFMRLER